MPDAVRAVMAEDPVPGDIFILNDPFAVAPICRISRSSAISVPAGFRRREAGTAKRSRWYLATPKNTPTPPAVPPCRYRRRRAGHAGGFDQPR
jgi:hypothetical protein